MEKSTFQFSDYKINKSVIELKKDGFNDNFNVNFLPSGIIDKINSAFYLNLIIQINNEDNTRSIEIDVTATYSFDVSESTEKLSLFFYTSAAAILFPYIRAYISTLTNLSGHGSINLPTFNLTGLGEILRQNTKTLEIELTH